MRKFDNIQNMRVWFSGRMRPSQGWDGSSILPTRTRVEWSGSPQHNKMQKERDYLVLFAFYCVATISISEARRAGKALLTRDPLLKNWTLWKSFPLHSTPPCALGGCFVCAGKWVNCILEQFDFTKNCANLTSELNHQRRLENVPLFSAGSSRCS